MTPTVLDYHSDCPTFSLAFSPLGTTTSTLKLAVGSYNESRAHTSSTTAFSSAATTSSGLTSTSSGSSFEDINNLTIVSLDPAYLDFEDVHPNDFDSSCGSSQHGTSNNQNHDHTSLSIEGYVRARNGQLLPSQSAFLTTARAPMPYPPSAISFSPASLSNQLQASSIGTNGETTREMIASSSECLRLWDLVASDGEMVGANSSASTGSGSAGGFVGAMGRRASAGPPTRLVERAKLANSKQEYSAPLTSFSWSKLEPTHIVTSSIDTTCTVWDISTRVPVTQLIAHDREVYDVAWSPASRDVFASVGADGSVRMFDLRSLEHSTILYEATSPSTSGSSSNKNGGGERTSSNQSHGSPKPRSKTPLPPSPLLRLAFSPTSPTYLSIVHADSTHVQILDTRSPGVPVMEVRGHAASVNGMAWGGSTLNSSGGGGGGGGDTAGPGWLATCSDDSTVLLWDLSTSPSPPTTSSTRTTASTTSGSGSATLNGPKMITTPSLSYAAPGEINAVAWGGGGEWLAAGCGKTVRCLKV